MRRASALFVVAFVLAGLAVYQYMTSSDDPSAAASATDFKPKAGFTTAAFELPDLNDQPYTVGGKQDKLTFVNFWASWCAPCELEAPDLQALQEKYGKEINLVGINATKFDKERGAREFVEEYEFTFPILMDRVGDITKQYKVENFPTSFLIDSDGVIQERINGVIPLAEWERLINKYK